MSDVRLVATNPEDSSLVPVACTPAGLIKTEVGRIEEIPNDVQIDGNLTVTGDYIGLPDVSGLPPAGDEGMVLQIVNGEPTWVFFEPPEPPEPPPDLVLLDDRDLSPPQTQQYGIWDGSALTDPGELTWDEAIKALGTWESQSSGTAGLMCRPSNTVKQASLTMPFRLDLRNGHGMVLQTHHSMQLITDDVPPSKTRFELTTNSENLIPLTSFVEEKNNDWKRKIRFTYLINRPDLGVVDFNLTATMPATADWQKPVYVTLQKFEYIPASEYLLRMTLKQRITAAVAS